MVDFSACVDDQFLQQLEVEKGSRRFVVFAPLISCGAAAVLTHLPPDPGSPASYVTACRIVSVDERAEVLQQLDGSSYQVQRLLSPQCLHFLTRDAACTFCA